jgi:hypothetical protein
MRDAVSFLTVLTHCADPNSPCPPCTDITWTSECWQAGIQLLSKLTSLQLKLPLILAAGEHLQLESLAGLNRLELMLDEPKTPGGAAEVRVWALYGGMVCLA